MKITTAFTARTLPLAGNLETASCAVPILKERTRTPLHNDPYESLLVQLDGTKVDGTKVDGLGRAVVSEIEVLEHRIS
jgi:hypothetical protein